MCGSMSDRNPQRDAHGTHAQRQLYTLIARAASIGVPLAGFGADGAWEESVGSGGNLVPWESRDRGAT
jgi:hypothetical protein